MTQKQKEEKRTLGDWFIRVAKGALIGIGAILPGLSGGVLAVIFGIYDRMISFLAKPLKNFGKDVLYFIPVGIGFVIGLLLFSFAVSAAFSTYEAIFVSLFLGFVAGTVPSLYRQAGKEGREKRHLVLMVVTAVVLFLLMNLLQSRSSIVISSPGFLEWIISGFLIGLGMIVPGLSTSNFLMYVGMYSKMTDGISSFDFSIILPLAIGLIICILLFSKFIHNLLKKHYPEMFHFILGTVIGSTLAILTTVILPALSPQGLAKMDLTLGMAILASVGLFILGTLFSYGFSLIEDKYAPED